MSVKSISNLKVKAIEFEREHRIVPKVMGAVTALTVCAVPASAEETTSTVDLSAVTTTLTSELTTTILLSVFQNLTISRKNLFAAQSDRKLTYIR